MKVICIKQDTGILSGLSKKIGLLTEGETYTVVSTSTIDGKSFYELSEFGYFDLFYSMLFIPLSTIDETELLTQRETNVVQL